MADLDKACPPTELAPQMQPARNPVFRRGIDVGWLDEPTLAVWLQVVAIIRKADDSAAASTALQDAFGMSKQQAEGVLNLSLRRLTSLEEQKLEAEDDSLTLRCGLPTRSAEPLSATDSCIVLHSISHSST